jgi:hypothetical protein
MIFSRRPRPPAAITGLLARDDRVVSWAPVADGAAVLASRFGLWWPADAGARLIGWQHVDKAVWKDGTLTVTEAEVFDDLVLVDLAPVSAVIDEPRDLPPAIKARVEASVARSELGQLTVGSARFVARRVPGRDGLTWWARLEPGTPDSPELRAEVGEIVASLRAQTLVR